MLVVITLYYAAMQFITLLLIFRSSLYILDTNPCRLNILRVFPLFFLACFLSCFIGSFHRKKIVKFYAFNVIPLFIYGLDFLCLDYELIPDFQNVFSFSAEHSSRC